MSETQNLRSTNKARKPEYSPRSFLYFYSSLGTSYLIPEKLLGDLFCPPQTCWIYACSCKVFEKSLQISLDFTPQMHLVCKSLQLLASLFLPLNQIQTFFLRITSSLCFQLLYLLMPYRAFVP